MHFSPILFESVTVLPPVDPHPRSMTLSYEHQGEICQWTGIVDFNNLDTEDMYLYYIHPGDVIDMTGRVDEHGRIIIDSMTRRG